MRIAMIHETFFDREPAVRLRRRLAEAAQARAALALLPELPLNPWRPAERTAMEADAEAPGGPRAASLAEAAQAAGLAVVGGCIVRDGLGVRRNTALAFDRAGRLIGAYAKCHLPSEPGFWETDHYAPGSDPARVVRDPSVPLPFGMQICSDIHRPEGAHALAAAGAAVILCPRATEAASWDRWRTVLRATALTACAFIITVNRPASHDAERAAGIGGPSAVIGPDGGVILETEEPVVVVDVDPGAIEAARRGYPGYLPVRSDLYARAWAGVPAPA